MVNTIFLGEPGGLTQDNLGSLINLRSVFDGLRAEKNAVILADSGQDPEFQANFFAFSEPNSRP